MSFHDVAALLLITNFIGGCLLVIAIEERDQLREQLKAGRRQ